MTEPLAIAQVTPFPWETHRGVNAFVRRLADELAGRGHRVVVLAPSDSRKRIRDSRRLVREAGGNPEKLFGVDGSPRVLAVGQSMPFPPAGRASAVALPIDVSRTIERILIAAPFDFVHVHEPFGPSASSAALRHSRSLNVGTFHYPTERVISTQLARRLVELVFGRLDARTASFETTKALVNRFFPGEYQVIPPGTNMTRASTEDKAPGNPGPQILFAVEEERGALRLFLQALRKMNLERPWRVTVWSPNHIETPFRLSRKLRERVEFRYLQDGSLADHLEAADVYCAASRGSAPVPQLLRGSMAAGAVPVVSRIPVYEEVTGLGEYGLIFDRGDASMLAEQLDRIVAGRDLRQRMRSRARRDQAFYSWAEMTDRFERIYETVAERRHSRAGSPEVSRRIAKRPFIFCDLHMHTDHSGDCATPVDILLETAASRGLGAVAVTDHNEIDGALDAARKARGLKVIVGEEIKTDHEGEVIGLFIHEKIPRGMSMAESIAEIKRQGGLVYVPHPFDRFHSVPDYEHLLKIVDDVDILEIFNPRVAFSTFNEEAERFAAKYRIVAGAGSDSHVPQGLGSVKIRMRDFDGPREFLQSLREADIIRRPTSLLYVQTLKFLQTKTPAPARRAVRPRHPRRPRETKRT